MAYPRVLAAGQRSQIWIGGPQMASPELIYETDSVLFEAPNWTLDGKHLVLNGDGGLWTLSLTSPDAGPDRVDLGQLPDLNNDHVLSPDGEHVYLSAMDTHIYRAPLAGGAAQRVTPEDGMWHFLHGVSPDDQRLAYVQISDMAQPGQLAILESDSSVSILDVGDRAPRRARMVTRRAVDLPQHRSLHHRPWARPARPDPRRRRTGREAADQRHRRLVPPPVPRRAAGHLHQLPGRHPRPPRRPRRRGPDGLHRRLDHPAAALPTVRRTGNPQRQQLGTRQQPVRLRRVPGRMSADPTAAPSVLAEGWLRPLGNTGLTVSAVAAGGGPIGSMPETFGYDVPAEQAITLVTEILRSPIRLIDTSNGYSDGESERRIGEGIRRVGGLPPGYWISTKVDGKDGDYSARRVRRSIEESAERLGLDHFPLVYLHDPEYALDQGLDTPGGAVDELVKLRDEGVIGHLGVAGGDVHVMHRFLDLNVFEVLLTHNRYTLVDRSADELITRAADAGLGVVNAAYLGGGMLANPHGATNYGYRPAARGHQGRRPRPRRPVPRVGNRPGHRRPALLPTRSQDSHVRGWHQQDRTAGLPRPVPRRQPPRGVLGRRRNPAARPLQLARTAHMTAIRLGILGAAGIAPQAVITPARRRDDLVVHAVASRRPGAATAYADTHHIPVAYDSYEDLLSSAEIDLVYVALPPSEHVQWSIAALEAGKHVLCEKPVAMNAAEAAQLADVAAHTGLHAIEAFHDHYHPLVRTSHRAPTQRRLGRHHRHHHLVHRRQPLLPRLDPSRPQAGRRGADGPRLLPRPLDPRLPRSGASGHLRPRTRPDRRGPTKPSARTSATTTSPSACTPAWPPVSRSPHPSTPKAPEAASRSTTSSSPIVGTASPPFSTASRGPTPSAVRKPTTTSSTPSSTPSPPTRRPTPKAATMSPPWPSSTPSTWPPAFPPVEGTP